MQTRKLFEIQENHNNKPITCEMEPSRDVTLVECN